jgi:hypothetical protein
MWEITMLGLINIARRMIEGAIISVLTLTLVAVLGVSETVNTLLTVRSAFSLTFLLVLVIILADLIGKFISIFSSTFPDLLPALNEEDLKRASLIQRLRPVQTVGLLSGAYAARLAMFLIIFILLGTSYALAPSQAQASLFGELGALEATEMFLREGVAGSVGYFLFFLGPENLGAITRGLVAQPLTPATVDGDVFLVGIRLYGLAFVLALLRTLVTPITYLRARRRADRLPAPSGSVA